MNRIGYFLFFLALLFPFAAKAENEETTVLHRLNVQDQDADGWYPATSTGGHFSIKMPRPFNDGTSRIGDTTMHLIVNPLTGDGWEYGVSEFEVEGNWKNKIDAENLAETARNLAGPAGSIGSITREGDTESIEGRKGSWLTPGVRFKFVHSVPQKRIYAIVCGYPRFSEAKADEICTKFIQSFRLK